MSGLKELAIEHFRGSVTRFAVPFETDSNITIIYGENATGKSTICDALELLSRGHVSSLENRGLGQTLRYWPALGKDYSEISVTLETTDGICQTTLARNGDVVVIPKEMRPRVEVFRRSDILSLMEATPGERYAAIRRFIDVSGIETSEAALRDLIREVAHAREVAAARVDENSDTIHRFWETSGSPGPTALEWAEIETTRAADASEAEIAGLSGLQIAYARLLEVPERLRSSQQALTAARKANAAATKALDERLQTVSKNAGEIVGILQAASAYLASNPSPQVCPLCESPDNTARLAKRIAERLSAFSALQETQRQVTATAEAVVRAEQHFQAARENARQDVTRFEQYRSELEWPPDVRLPSAPPPMSLTALNLWLDQTSRLPAEWKNAEAARHDKKQFLATLRQALRTWQDNRDAQDRLEHLLPRLERGLKTVADERRRFTDEILAAISEEVGRLYEIVHPGEGLNKITLELDPKKRASLEISAKFHGRNTRPQAYFSDSHLDTLAVCVFLALSGLDQPENTILVLDDVLATVDEPHATRLLQLLQSEAARFQHCIVTTHYLPWKRWANQTGCQIVELLPWNADHGLVLNTGGSTSTTLRNSNNISNVGLS
jgi:hypothetical protein